MVKKISSTRSRQLTREGKVKEANKLLGHGILGIGIINFMVIPWTYRWFFQLLI